MTYEHFLFVDGDDHVPCGVVSYDLTHGCYRALSAVQFAPTEPLFHVEVSLRYHDTFDQWHHFAYQDANTTVELQRAADGAVTTSSGTPVAVSGGVPTYAERLIVGQLLANGADRISYPVFSDNEPESLRPAEWVRQPAENVTLLDGYTVTADVVQFVLDGDTKNRHWCQDGHILVSDWCGAQSFRCPDNTTVTTAVPTPVAKLVTNFIT